MTIAVLDANGTSRTISTIDDLLDVVATQATLAAILAKIIAAPATEAKQDAANTALAALAPVAPGASTDRTFNGTSAQSGALVGTLIRVVAEGANCRIAIGADPTAGATSTLLIDGVPEYFRITSGHKVAAIRSGSDDGTLNITVCG